MLLPERVWLLRHAETATPAVLHGAESDVGLSELGHATAKIAGEWFREHQPTVVYSSGMLRARDTAQPIALQCNIPHRIAEDLHERRVGALSGTVFASHSGPWAETIQRWVAGETAYTTPGAESFDEIQKRVLSCWDTITQAQPQERVVIVAHGIVCRVILLSLLESYGPQSWVKLGRVANLAISELTPRGSQWHAERLLEVPEAVIRLTEETLAMRETSRSRSEA